MILHVKKLPEVLSTKTRLSLANKIKQPTSSCINPHPLMLMDLYKMTRYYLYVFI